MRSLIVALAALCLAACATTPAQVHYDAGTALLAAETGLDTAVRAATVAVQQHLTSPAQNAEIGRLTAPCPAGVPVTLAVAQAHCPVKGGLALARAAYAASDAASWPALAANLLGLTAQLVASHP